MANVVLTLAALPRVGSHHEKRPLVERRSERERNEGSRAPDPLAGCS